MGSFLSLNFEKWLIDEEVYSNIRQSLTPVEISETTIDEEFIISVGQGEYLTQIKTFNEFKTLSQPNLFGRIDYDKWTDQGSKRIEEIATEHLQRRRDQYTKPMLDPTIEKAIDDFVISRK